MKVFLISAMTLGLIACSTTKDKSSEMTAAEKAKVVKADVMGADGVLGEVTLSPAEEGVKVSFMVRNLPKGKTLASHIHEKAECTPPDFKSAGGHYNPKNVRHGAPDSNTHHLGDLGNFEVDKNGVLKAEKVFEFLSLDPESDNFIGNRALIIHEGEDKFTQPSGDAGGRLACAIL